MALEGRPGRSERLFPEDLPKADRKNQRLVLRRGDDPSGSKTGGQRSERDHRIHEHGKVQASVSDALLEPAGRSGRVPQRRKAGSLQGTYLFSEGIRSMKQASKTPLF